MASEKSKASGKNAAYDRLRKAIKEKAPARAYLFYGEESYLRFSFPGAARILISTGSPAAVSQPRTWPTPWSPCP